ncbi:MAG: glutathione synthase/RimK-type ligase-like ATP-grasp enzyme [Paraglaciecola sp.]|jgi:glutathione synthase/RimK-type ligase-like ATP-grasp enzyme
MKRCAFLSMDSLEDFFAYDDMLFAPLARLGWQAEEVSWRKEGLDWDSYDVVVIRSTWDYQTDPQAFLTCLAQIEASTARLENSLKLVKWNISKEYLKDIANQGITIVPTRWMAHFDLADVAKSFAHFSCDHIVIKPLVSANADHTYRLSREQLLSQATILKTTFSDRAFMVQPFMQAIVDEGEYSLFYFAGHYSHSILKMPKADDFRVQEEHGGQLKLIEPSDEMLTTARHTLASLPDDALYARIDLIRHAGGFAIMEVELIEPSLYFNMDPQSPQRFADAFVEMFGKG